MPLLLRLLYLLDSRFLYEDSRNFLGTPHMRMNIRSLMYFLAFSSPRKPEDHPGKVPPTRFSAELVSSPQARGMPQNPCEDLFEEEHVFLVLALLTSEVEFWGPEPQVTHEVEFLEATQE